MRTDIDNLISEETNSRKYFKKFRQDLITGNKKLEAECYKSEKF